MGLLTRPKHDLAPAGLIVDPHEDTRKLHRAILESLIVQLEEAEDGAEALAKAVRLQPALVLTEARLPRIDGYTLCELLRADPATRASTILLVTASAFPADLDRARRVGADDVIVKPCSPDLLEQRVRELLLKSREFDQRVAPSRACVPDQDQVRSVPDDLERADQLPRRVLSRAHRRETTTTPPLIPPDLRCPACDEPLAYDHSQVGGVSPRFPEQWDYLKCRTCGAFQYRHRTKRLRRV